MKKKKQSWVAFSLAMGFFIVFIAMLFCLPTEGDTILQEVVDFATKLACISVYIIAACIVSCIIYSVLSLMHKSTVKTWLQLTADHFSAKLDYANVRNVAGCLLPFLYQVLSLNNDTLHLSLTADPSCLLAPGNGVSHRENAVFFRFALVSSHKPDIDNTMLRQIIQSHVLTELNSYGISGLRPFFTSRNNGTIPAVYLDRVIYNDVAHVLYLDVLYICTEESARYVVKSIQRDAAKVQPEREFFDDEL